MAKKIGETLGTSLTKWLGVAQCWIRTKDMADLMDKDMEQLWSTVQFWQSNMAQKKNPPFIVDLSIKITETLHLDGISQLATFDDRMVPYF